MDIKKMLADQKELDDKILSNAGIEKYPLENIKLALLVELGELANEWQGFKHWKKHREINREKLLEEFADCLHFALSIENYYESKDHKLNGDFSEDSFNSISDFLGKDKTTLTDIIEGFFVTYDVVLNDTRDVLVYIVGLGLMLGISKEEMEQAYYKKNAVNYKRQEEGY
ncbi:dUTP diphosphatase [Clostridium luticellarii]|uniref:dUTPase n=1 Tax=Clostridium luticellarii TaxID=1691940 RepID=A0A2T0BNV0_9CLOT|nr:dUTP diphosphatase [Clostridium luticellarii]PRR85543.1 dUTPase [Clostridium luticellarii]